MEQSVYIDLYCLVNFSMDLLALMITAALLHLRVKRLRAILAAAFGGIYASAALLFGLSGVLGFAGDLVCALALCYIAFRHKGSSHLHTLRAVPVLFLVSMTLGGVMTALYALLNRLNLPFEALQGDGLSVWTFALLTAVAGIATLRGGSFMGLSRKTKTVTVHATLFGKAVTLHAMVDSGNLLRDPVSGTPVIVADLDRLRSCLPCELYRACARGDLAHILASNTYRGHIRPIPSQTATGASLLIALTPERLTLTVGKDTYPASYLIAPAPLGESAQGFDAVISLH